MNRGKFASEGFVKLRFTDYNRKFINARKPFILQVSFCSWKSIANEGLQNVKRTQIQHVKR